MRFRLAAGTSVTPMGGLWPLRPERIAPVVRSLTYRFRDLPRTRSTLARVGQARSQPDLLTAQQRQRLQYVLAHEDRIRVELDALALRHAPEARFAEQVAEFQAALAVHARGGPLEALWARMPELLRDGSELGYGSLNQPMLKIFERLMYATQAAALPAGLHFHVKSSDVEYCPVRIALPEDLVADAARARLVDPRWDRLFGAGLARGELAELLGTDAEDGRLEQLFRVADGPPVGGPAAPDASTGVRLRYFGHACVLVQAAGVSLLVDPLIPVHAAHGPRRFSFDDLPVRIDAVLVTHAHADHVDIGSLLRIRHRVDRVLVPAGTGELGDVSLKAMFEHLGFKDVRAMDALDSVRVGAATEAVAMPFLGEHGELAHGKACWFVRAADETLLFAADAKCGASRALARALRVTGPAGTVFIGTCCAGDEVAHHYDHLLAWGGGPASAGRLTDGSTADEAWTLVRDAGAKNLFVYALGLEPWNEGLLGRTPAIYVDEAQRLVALARNGGLARAQVLNGAQDLWLGG